MQGERRGDTALDKKTQTRHKGFAEHSRRTRKSGGERPLAVDNLQQTCYQTRAQAGDANAS